MVEALSLAGGLSWASGLRLYLAVLLAGLYGRVGLLHLPPGLALLASPWVIAVAALLAATEFLADKVPAFDSLWDALHTLIRIPAGAVLAASAMGHGAPPAELAAALSGASLACLAHLGKAGMRVSINLCATPVPNWAASLAEDVLALMGLVLALFAPVLFIAWLLAFIVLACWGLPRLWRRVQTGYRGMAMHMVPQLSPAHLIGTPRSFAARRD